MKRFRVTFERKEWTIATATIVVEAASKEEAEEVANQEDLEFERPDFPEIEGSRIVETKEVE